MYWTDALTDKIQRANLDGSAVEFPIDSFARFCLLHGIDQLGFIQQQLAAIESFEEQRSWTP